MDLRSLSIALALCLALPLAAGGEEPAPPAAGPLLHGSLEISLADAIRMGLENNLDVQIERYSPLLAALDESAAWGAYDPIAFAEYTYRDTKTPNTFGIDGVTTSVVRSNEGFAGLRGIVPILGTELSAQYDAGRSTLNSGIETLSPKYSSGWSIDVAQPVLRDLFWNEPWTQVRTTRLLRGSSEEDFRRAMMDEVEKIESAYWTLIASEEALRVANKSLETARALLDQTNTQYEVGVVSKVEVTEAEAGVSQREVEQIRALNTYRNQQDVLIDLVLGPNLRAASTLELRPTDRPDDFVPYEVDVEAAVARAFENRPEVARAHQDVERGELQARFARNQVLPSLDGIFRFGQSGVAGDDNPNSTFPPPQRFLGDFDDAHGDYEDFPQYVVGARVSLPFPNRTARATASKREIELGRARSSLRRLEQQIIIEVRQAARNLLAAQEGIAAAQNARRAAAEQLRAEEIRLQYGESTPFDVLQREEALVEREREEIESFQAWRTSAAALDRAQGTILRNHNIKIAEVAPLR